MIFHITTLNILRVYYQRNFFYLYLFIHKDFLFNELPINRNRRVTYSTYVVMWPKVFKEFHARSDSQVVQYFGSLSRPNQM